MIFGHIYSNFLSVGFGFSLLCPQSDFSSLPQGAVEEVAELRSLGALWTPPPQPRYLTTPAARSPKVWRLTKLKRKRGASQPQLNYEENLALAPRNPKSHRTYPKSLKAWIKGGCPSVIWTQW
ncbi:hypothetical protein MUG91_G9n158 [Manis pentadactyla]|nr:hypothetical protein MUG91_G9n158 [Manis pentadactyla]